MNLEYGQFEEGQDSSPEGERPDYFEFEKSPQETDKDYSEQQTSDESDEQSVLGRVTPPIPDFGSLDISWRGRAPQPQGSGEKVVANIEQAVDDPALVQDAGALHVVTDALNQLPH